MQWYYAQNGQRLGPYGDADFAQLVNGGQVMGDTLVWHEGMANWQAYSQVLAAAGLAQSIVGSASSAVAASGDGEAGQVAFCTQCGRYGVTSDMIAYEGAWVCPDCKEMFFQRVREGLVSTQRPSAVRYAGFWIRFVAVLIDVVVFFGAFFIIAAIGGVLARGASAPGRDPAGSLSRVIALVYLVGLVTWIAYETWVVGACGATVGKLACGLRIIRPDGQKVTYARAFGRYFAKHWFGVAFLITCIIVIVSNPLGQYRRITFFSGPALGCFSGILALVALVGYVMAGFTNQKRALHDMICDTRVIWK